MWAVADNSPEIVLSTLTAKYIHASFGLRYLYANMGDLYAATEMLEFDINMQVMEIAEAIVTRRPRIVGFGVYIWNVTQTAELIALLRRLQPDLIIILGGPEVSHEIDQQQIVALADYVITGEADLEFANVCRQILADQRPASRIIRATLPDVTAIVLPYDLYNVDDIAHRVIYVEASRGCPFSCEFCLSSVEAPVRQFDLGPFLDHMDRLLERGLQQFKFVDRTFNLNIRISLEILNFFLVRMRPGLFIHFEMVPDRLPDDLREIIARFPAGSLQFEVGIQTFNPDIAKNISRRQNYQRLADNLTFLRSHTGVHIHADLIAGLPGETLESFADGFDQLIHLAPQEIQIGILKRLRGTPITRHDQTWGMVYAPAPPYEILYNKSLDFATLQRLRRFSRYWDLVGNSGNFSHTIPQFWASSDASPFYAFMAFSDWLYATIKSTSRISLTRLTRLIFEYLTKIKGLSNETIARSLIIDYQQGGRRDTPDYLRPFSEEKTSVRSVRQSARGALPKRQSRHSDTSTKS